MKVFLGSNTFVPRMYVGFFPFLPSLETEYSTLFSAMKDFTQLSGQLEQDALQVFCDEGVFRIVTDIFLQKKDSYQFLVAFTMENICNIVLGSTSEVLD